VKPASQISDRAKRYRANRADVLPPPPKQCGFCGRRQNIGVHHVDGVEDHGEPDNLMWACKSCNTKIAIWMKRLGLGKLTRQMNAGKRSASGSKRAQMDTYAAAIKVMRGEWEGDLAKAIATIRATPRSIRSAYTSRTWPLRKQIYGPSGRGQGSLFGGGGDVPF
jgi:hypothetical protein